MRSTKSIQVALSVAGLLLASFSPALAKTQRPAHARYDLATETTVMGTVQEVREIPHGTWSAGIHLTLKTAQGAVDVHVGPAMFVATHGMTLAKGDLIGVTGSTVLLDGKEALLAREVRKGKKTLTLRDSEGLPEWSRASRPSQ